MNLELKIRTMKPPFCSFRTLKSDKHVKSFNMKVSKTRVRFPHAPRFDGWKDAIV